MPRETGGGGNGSRTAKRAAARENKVPSRTTLWRAKKAREVAAAEDYDNVSPHADDIQLANLIFLILAMLIMTMLASGWALVQVVLEVVPMLNRCRPLTPGQCRCRHSARLVRIATHMIEPVITSCLLCNAWLVQSTKASGCEMLTVTGAAKARL
jgi:hypothetical protein